MTKDSLLKMEMGKKFKVALTIPLVDIMKLSLSPDSGNQVVIIQLRGMLCRVWHYRLWSFKTRDTKLERFLPKSQHTQRKLLNFENWTNGEPQ